MQRFTVDKHLTIVRRCIDGDRAAQKEIFDSLSGKMLSLCLRYTADYDTALDLLQDGFVTLFTKMDTYKGDGSFEGWARKIFVTTCLMFLRKKDALKMSEDLQSAQWISEDAPSATDRLGYKELMKLISGMPDGYRVVFNLYVIEGFQHSEISRMLGISEATSRSQLGRARNWLQKRIEENEKNK